MQHLCVFFLRIVYKMGQKFTNCMFFCSIRAKSGARCTCSASVGIPVSRSIRGRSVYRYPVIPVSRESPRPPVETAFLAVSLRSIAERDFSNFSEPFSRLLRAFFETISNHSRTYNILCILSREVARHDDLF